MVIAAQNAPVTEIDHDSVCSVPVGSMVALVSGAQKYKPVNLNDLPSTAPEPVREHRTVRAPPSCGREFLKMLCYRVSLRR